MPHALPTDSRTGENAVLERHSLTHGQAGLAAPQAPRAYRLNIPAFEGLRVNVFAVIVGPLEQPTYTALIDTGSAQPNSRAALEQLPALLREHGEHFNWATLTRIVVTHPHPDHAGGLPHLRTLTAAPVAAHTWAVPIIRDPAGVRDAMRETWRAYRTWLGVPDDHAYATRLGNRANNLMLPTGVPVDTPVQHGDRLDDLFDVLHTPGHDGAQICLRAGDALFSADHLLARNTPPLVPAWVQRGAGLGTYLRSLKVIEALTDVRVALGGHDEPMPDWPGRIQEIRARFDTKLQAVLDAADQPMSVFDLTHRVARVNARQALLLMDQTAALCEELVTRGDLSVRQTVDGAALFTRQ